MIHFLGTLFLFSALGFAFFQSVPVLYGYYTQNPYLLALSRPTALGQFICIMFAFGLLGLAFIINDFSIAYVAAHSHPQLPTIYKLAAAWGGPDGSLLFWIFILNGWSISCIISYRHHRLLPLIASLYGIISFGFLCCLLFTSNPFALSPNVGSAHDLNPLLQDPGFLIHPPMLYFGYVGFSAPFIITLALLLADQFNAKEMPRLSVFTIAAWCFLTAGIALGSWWAYRVLGWGGFWFWDPVENVSLLPWLSGTALIHVLLLVNKHNTATAWAAFLSILCFALSILGTFLVRSGILISVHTFSSDPTRGFYLLALFTLIILLSLILYCAKLPSLKSKRIRYSFFSSDFFLLLNSGIVCIALLTVMLGTLYPLMIDALHLGRISVGSPYFNIVLAPIALSSLPLMCIAGYLQKRNIPMIVAHAGFFILIMGIIFSSLLKQDKEVRLHPGDQATLGPYTFYFMDMSSLKGENFRSIRAEFKITKGSRYITSLFPEKRIYPIRNTVLTKVDIHPGLFRDLYIALGEPLDQNNWSVRLYYKPFIRWIWLGSLIMIIGGLLAMKTSSVNALRKQYAQTK